MTPHYNVENAAKVAERLLKEKTTGGSMDFACFRL